jgi:hypothetical protein
LIFEALGLEKLKPKVARLGSGLVFAGSFHHFWALHFSGIAFSTRYVKLNYGSNKACSAIYLISTSQQRLMSGST